MQTWKKKLVVSQLALACTLAIASQANAKDISGTTYMIIPHLRRGIMATQIGITRMPPMMVTFIRSSINQP